MSNPLDKFFDMAESVVGGVEKTLQTAHHPDKDYDAIDAEIVSETKIVKSAPPPMLGKDGLGAYWHLYPDGSNTALCGKTIEPRYHRSLRRTDEDFAIVCLGCIAGACRGAK